MKTTSLAVLMLLSTLADPLGAQSMGIIPPPGQPFPEMGLPSPDGKMVTTQALLGKRIVLHVFASW